MVSCATSAQLKAEIAARTAGDSQVHTFAERAVAAEANVRAAADIALAHPALPTNRALGAYIDGSAWDFPRLDAHSLLVGGMPTFATTYHHWGARDGGTWGNVLWALGGMTARRITDILTWEPWDWDGTMPQPAYALSTIPTGAHDVVIDDWIAGAVAYGQPLYIRPMHEMNILDAYPWCMGVNGNTPEQFVAAWRYIVDRFRAAGATNVKWVWSPHTVDTDKPLTGLYPGDTYVDMIGIDGYNRGTAFGWSTWLTFTETFVSTYDEVLAHAKPIIISEVACTESGGDKAAWIASAFLTEIPNRFPALVGVLWFNQNKETDWRVESSVASLNAYRMVVATASWSAVI